MTLEQLKVIISADDSKFQKALKDVEKSIKHIPTNSKLGDSFDAASVKAYDFVKSYNRALDAIYESTHHTAEMARKAWVSEIDSMIEKTKIKLQYLSKQFAATGYSDFWGAQIDESDAYLRKLKEYREAVSGGLVDIDTTNLDKIPQAVEEATRSIENIDLRMEATVDIEDGQLKQSAGVIKAIEDALNEIDKLRIEPVTPESVALIKLYKKQIEELITA